jgi:GTP cyclohydrolase I
MKTIKLSNQDVIGLTTHMNIEPKNNIFGIPRGGVPVAYLCADQFDCYVVDNVEDADYVVDDIVVSGKTRDQWMKKARKDAEFRSLVSVPLKGVWYVYPWEGSVTGSAEDIVIRQLEAIGEDPKRDGLRDTPDRVVKMWPELFGGYVSDPLGQLGKSFENDGQYDQMVILRNIEFYSTCEHHLLPFFGKVHIGYIPSKDGRVVGISKLSRVVHCFGRRLQIQERMTQQIADALEEALSPVGVAVYVEAQHLCMMARGVRQAEAVMVTTALKGVFLERDAARSEFLALLK